MENSDEDRRTVGDSASNLDHRWRILPFPERSLRGIGHDQFSWRLGYSKAATTAIGWTQHGASIAASSWGRQLMRAGNLTSADSLRPARNAWLCPIVGVVVCLAGLAGLLPKIAFGEEVGDIQLYVVQPPFEANPDLDQPEPDSASLRAGAASKAWSWRWIREGRHWRGSAATSVSKSPIAAAIASMRTDSCWRSRLPSTGHWCPARRLPKTWRVQSTTTTHRSIGS